MGRWRLPAVLQAHCRAGPMQNPSSASQGAVCEGRCDKPAASPHRPKKGQRDSFTPGPVSLLTLLQRLGALTWTPGLGGRFKEKTIFCYSLYYFLWRGKWQESLHLGILFIISLFHPAFHFLGDIWWVTEHTDIKAYMFLGKRRKGRITVFKMGLFIIK